MQVQATNSSNRSSFTFPNDLPNNLPNLAGDTAYDYYGLEVAILQRLLVFYGYLPNTDITGFFGDTTNVAVIQFQGEQGLAQDGVVGPETWAALANLSINVSAPTIPNS